MCLKFVQVPMYERLQTGNVGTIYQKYIRCTNSKIGKTPTNKGISKAYIYLYNVWWEQGM